MSYSPVLFFVGKQFELNFVFNLLNKNAFLFNATILPNRNFTSFAKVIHLPRLTQTLLVTKPEKFDFELFEFKKKLTSAISKFSSVMRVPPPKPHRRKKVFTQALPKKVKSSKTHTFLVCCYMFQNLHLGTVTHVSSSHMHIPLKKAEN